jgi:DNA mismatch endonuclease, patch repair protein
MNQAALGDMLFAGRERKGVRSRPDHLMSRRRSTDTLSRAKRSALMSRVRSRNSAPEMQVRSALHGAGFRFRLHRRDLPGKPDIVLPKYRAVVLVHGCFWHQHRNCKKTTLPKQNASFWAKKLRSNVLRDRRVQRRLRDLGWRVIVVWECEVRRDLTGLLTRLNTLNANLTHKWH